jgi:hypothetical protein
MDARDHGVNTLEKLRRAIFDACAVFHEKTYTPEQDHAARVDALEMIEEVLDGKPLGSFSGQQLELLSLLYAYWREAEVESSAAEPDRVQ